MKFDGTIGGVAHIFRTHLRSNYNTVSHRTRLNYDGQINRILLDCGAERVSDIDEARLHRLYAEWAKSGIPMANAIMGILRRMLGFAADVFEDGDCIHAYLIAYRARFQPTLAHGSYPEELTDDQIAYVHERTDETRARWAAHAANKSVE